MELTIKLNLLDLVDAENQIANVQKVIRAMKGESAPVSFGPVTTESDPATLAFIEGYLEECVDAPVVAETTHEFLLKETQAAKVFGDILVRIEAKGEATLEDIAQDWGVDRKTIRGHFLNGMRFLKHRQQTPPFNSAWVPERRCVVYTAK